jgi:hypothetical protein
LLSYARILNDPDRSDRDDDLFAVLEFDQYVTRAAVASPGIQDATKAAV